MFDLMWEEEGALYTAIGAIIINWGIVESSVSQACYMLVDAGGHRSQRLPPKEFQRRLKFIKSCFKDYPELQPMRDFCRGLISESKQLVPHRDFIIHGVVTAYDRASMTFEFVRLDAEQKKYEPRGTRLSIAVLLELSDSAAKIGSDWIKLVQRMHSLRDSKQGLQYANRVRHGPVRERAYRVYEGVQRAICRALGCHA